MKKISLLLLGMAFIALPSCMNSGNQEESEAEEEKELSQEEQLLAEQLKFNMKNLIESAKHLKAAPFVEKDSKGTFSLTEKEKMVKPTYLMDPASTGKLTSLSQKYRAVATLGVDKVIAELYGMPTLDYKTEIMKLVLELGDPAMNDFAKTVWENDGSVNEAIQKLVDASYEEERSNYFWEFVAAGLIEQIYVLSENLDKFLPLFDDQTASDITFNFVCVHYGLTEMVKLYPEMASLDEALVPLYVINATSVKELETQLRELKSDITRIRETML